MRSFAFADAWICEYDSPMVRWGEEALGYPYPQPVDDQVSAYLEAIRQMPSPPQ